jgi:hypothetical protein
VLPRRRPLASNYVAVVPRLPRGSPADAEWDGPNADPNPNPEV